MVEFTSVRQIGIVVNDLEETIRTYTEQLGCTEWYRFQILPEDLVKYPQIIRGKEKVVGFKGAKTLIGTVEFEFFESLQGETIYKEYIDEQPRNKGVQHIAFNTDNFQKAAEYLTSKYTPLQIGVTPTGMKVMLFDTYEDFGYSIEISGMLEDLNNGSEK